MSDIKGNIFGAIIVAISSIIVAVITGVFQLKEKNISDNSNIDTETKLISETFDTESPKGNNNIINNIQINGNNNSIDNNVDDDTKKKIKEINNKTNQILENSERQPQIIMAEYVQFSHKNQSWTAPNMIYPGSIVELHGFECQLTLSASSGFTATLMGEGWNSTKEIIITGKSGEGLNWSVESSGNCKGKIIVFSSPRVRSTKQSWYEEKINTTVITEEK